MASDGYDHWAGDLEAELREAVRCSILGLPLPKRPRKSDEQLLCEAQEAVEAFRALGKFYGARTKYLVDRLANGPMSDEDRVDIELAIELNPIRRKRGQRTLQKTPQLEAALAKILPATSTKEPDDL